jgi:Tripartite tricarboxylate transporter family receptor
MTKTLPTLSPTDQSKNRISRRGVLAAGMGLSLAGCGSSTYYWSSVWRQKLTLEVETPDGPRSGFNVIEKTFYRVSFPHRALRTTTKGEAIYLDFGIGRRPLIALLTNEVENGTELFGLGALERAYEFRAFGPFSEHETDERLAKLIQMRGPREIRLGATMRLGRLPDFATFDDPLRPETLRRVDPMDMAVALAIAPLIIVAHPSAGIATPQQLLAELQAKPGKLNYATPGIASPQHLVGEYIKMVAAVDMQHVPYKGVAPAVQDVVSGHLPLTITGLPPVVSHLKAGTVKAVAVTTGKRTSLLPDVPAFAELGDTYKDIDVSIWFGFLAPAGISQDIIAKLHATIIVSAS